MEAMMSYCKFLEEQRSKNATCHAALVPIRSVRDDWDIFTIEGRSDWDQHTFGELSKALSDLDMYKPLSLIELWPEERHYRKHWIEKLKLPYL
jgi:hypothetical protein